MHHRIEIIGYVGSDAKVSQVDDKNFVINFNLADSREYPDKTQARKQKKRNGLAALIGLKKSQK